MKAMIVPFSGLINAGFTTSKKNEYDMVSKLCYDE
jgi:hypothetical protein